MQASAINVKLPPVSYTKAIDVWINICQAFIFGALLEFAYVTYVGEKDARARRTCVNLNAAGVDEKIDRTARPKTMTRQQRRQVQERGLFHQHFDDDNMLTVCCSKVKHVCFQKWLQSQAPAAITYRHAAVQRLPMNVGATSCTYEPMCECDPLIDTTPPIRLFNQSAVAEVPGTTTIQQLFFQILNCIELSNTCAHRTLTTMYGASGTCVRSGSS
jgi:hypothetical protein